MKHVSRTYYLFAPDRAEWIRIFDGFTLGRKRHGEKFAVDLEKSSFHCVFRLGAGGKPRIIDLSGLGATTLNGKRVPFGTELELCENDHLRINRRDLFVTRGMVRPVPRPEETPGPAPMPAPEDTPRSPAPRRRASPRPVPLSQFRGSPLKEGPPLGQRLNERFKDLGRALAGAAQELFLRLKPFAESIVVAVIAVTLMALTARKLLTSHAESPEAPAQRLAASDRDLPSSPPEFKQVPLREAPLLAKGPDLEHPLPPPQKPGTREERTPPRAQGALARVARVDRYERLPPASAEPRAKPLHPLSAPPRFEVIPVIPEAGPVPESEPVPETGHVRITAISVLHGDDRQTTFEGAVPARTVVAALEDMNRRPDRAPAGTQSFYDPSIRRGPTSYRLDWCYHWETSCGKPAADAFCREMGMSESVAFEKAARVGNAGAPTAIIGQSGVFCPGKSPGHPCDGFSSIECRRSY